MKRSYPRIVSARKRAPEEPPLTVEMDREGVLEMLRPQTESLAARAALLTGAGARDRPQTPDA